MIDIKLIRENRELVKENIKKKFQDEKLSLVDDVYNYDIEYRECKSKGDLLRSEKNKLSASIGELMRNKKIDEANEIKAKVNDMNHEIEDLEKREAELEELIKTYTEALNENYIINKGSRYEINIKKFNAADKISVTYFLEKN